MKIPAGIFFKFYYVHVGDVILAQRCNTLFGDKDKICSILGGSLGLVW